MVRGCSELTETRRKQSYRCASQLCRDIILPAVVGYNSQLVDLILQNRKCGVWACGEPKKRESWQPCDRGSKRGASSVGSPSDNCIGQTF